MTARVMLKEFYRLMTALASHPAQGRALAEYTGYSPLPRRGVYFFQEPGEFRRISGAIPRIVRVGTHAVSTGSRTTLWARLRTHRGTGSGNGNHRGSVFRRHVGTALLHRDGGSGDAVPTWAVGRSAEREIRGREAAHELRVSAHLASMSVLWVEVPDEPSSSSDRAYIERNAIALLSNALHPIDHPTRGWLGMSSPVEEIRASGLWNVKHVRERSSPDFLDCLAEYVEQTIRSRA